MHLMQLAMVQCMLFLNSIIILVIKMSYFYLENNNIYVLFSSWVQYQAW